MIFKILLLFFHCTNSFLILNGYEEDLLAVKDGSVTIYAKVDSDFWSCHLKKNGVQICQMTWDTPSLFKWYYSEKMSCTPKFNHVKYGGGGSYSDCKFVVPNLQENGNKNNFSPLLKPQW